MMELNAILVPDYQQELLRQTLDLQAIQLGRIADALARLATSAEEIVTAAKEAMGGNNSNIRANPRQPIRRS